MADEGPRPKVFDPGYDRVKKSSKKERDIAKRLGGYTHKRSGGLPWSRGDETTACGDVTTPELHIEHKRIGPGTKSVGLKREWLRKVTVGAERRMKTPAMVFHFEGAEGYDEDWLLMPLDLAERLLSMLRGP